MPAEGMPLGRVNLVVALRAEARPVIERFGLSPGPASAFPVFASRHADVGLVVSGVGRARSAAAVAHLAATEADAAWLNVGIAGHRNLALGVSRMAHKIRCQGTSRSWYPPLVFEPPCETASVRTVDTPCADFPTLDLYDMECAGYYEIATRFAPRELIHALKVVSDNTVEPHAAISRDAVSDLIAGRLGTIDAVIEALRPLSGHLRQHRREPTGLPALLEATRFTATQRRRLRRLLRRWSVVLPAEDAAEWVSEHGGSEAGGILAALDARLESVAPSFRETQ